MMVNAVCFDLDDTLYEYREYAKAGLKSAADLLEERTGVAVQNELETLYFDQGLTDNTFDIILDRYDLSAQLLEDLVDAFHGASGPLKPAPETEPVLSELSEGYKLGLITDGRGGDEKLDRLGIRDYFDDVLVTHPLGRSKHEPRVFEQMLDSLSVGAATAMYVGDDPRVDFTVPNTLGMRTVRIRRGRYVDIEPTDQNAAPDHEISSLDELFELL